MRVLEESPLGGRRTLAAGVVPDDGTYFVAYHPGVRSGGAWLLGNYRLVIEGTSAGGSSEADCALQVIADRPPDGPGRAVTARYNEAGTGIRVTATGLLPNAFAHVWLGRVATGERIELSPAFLETNADGGLTREIAMSALPAGSYRVYVADYTDFERCGSATAEVTWPPTVLHTPTPTETPSPTPTPSPSPTATDTVAPSPTPSASPTPTATSEPLPVIFVPGMAGSVLAEYTVEGGYEELWPGPFEDHMRLSLYPADNPSPNIVARDVYRDGYQSLLDALKAVGYVEYELATNHLARGAAFCAEIARQHVGRPKPSLFPFPYDWRHSNARSAAKLAAYVGCVREFHPGRKVNLVAHSNGGLVSRRYILDRPEDHHVNALITLGTPFLGAPKQVYVLGTGQFLNFPKQPIVGFPRTFRRILGSFDGANELLPSQAYWDLGGRPALTEAGYDFNGNGIDPEAYPYPQFVSVIDTKYGRAPFAPGTAGSTFHAHATAAGQQDDWRTDASGVRYFHVFGIKSGLSTVGSVRMVTEVACSIVLRTCVIVRHGVPQFTVGDGTVPSLSLQRRGRLDYNAPGARLVPVRSTAPGLDDGSDHNEMLHTALVHGLVRTFLEQAGRSFVSWVPAQDPPPVRPMTYLTLSGVGDVVVQDQHGGSTAPISATLAGRIPGVDVYHSAEDVRVATLPISDTYSVSFDTGDRPLSIQVTYGTDVTASLAVRYRDLVLPAGITATLTISAGGVAPLVYDADGDGRAEGTIAPTVAVTGALASDLEPPRITLDLVAEGVRRRATLEVSDSEAGVAAVYWSLDGRRFEPYTAPLALEVNAGAFLYAFADDRVANRSSLATFRLAYPAALPALYRDGGPAPTTARSSAPGPRATGRGGPSSGAR